MPQLTLDRKERKFPDHRRNLCKGPVHGQEGTKPVQAAYGGCVLEQNVRGATAEGKGETLSHTRAGIWQTKARGLIVLVRLPLLPQ